MSKICDICGRKPLRGNSRSHSNIANRRWQKLNLQTKTIKGERLSVCTSCLKNLARKTK